MRRLITILAVVLLVAVATVVALPLLLSPERASAEVSSRLTALTGYDVIIGGDTELRLFPSLRFAIHDVRLRSNTGAELAEARTLTGSIALLPLLSGRVEVDRFSLIAPRFDLEIDAAGRSNWALSDSSLIGAAISRPETVPAGSIHLGDIRIRDGSLRYVDHRQGLHHELEELTGTLSWPTLADPLSGSGSLRWDEDLLELSVTADKPLAFMDRGSSAVRLSITSRLVNASFAGNAHLTDDIQFGGRLSLSTPSIRRLLHRIGTDLGAGSGLEGFELSGHINLLGETAVVSDLRMTLDGNRAEGSMKVDIEKERIGLQGTLAFETLDLNRYRSPDEPEQTVRSGTPDDPMTTPLDLSDLHKTVADIRISAQRIMIGDLRLSDTAGTVTVRDGILTLGIAETALHGGLAMGTVRASQTETGIETRIGVTLDRVTTRDLLSQFAGIDWIDGLGSLNATLAARGRTLNDIIAGLSGNIRVIVSDGTLSGIDLAAVIDAIRSGRLQGWPAGAGARTPFGEITGSFHLADGVATTQDFRLRNPDLEVLLAGRIGLVSAVVDGRGTAELTSGGGGLAMPFKIEGPLARPLIYPDPQWLLDQAAGRHLGRVGERIDGLRDDERIDGLIREGLERIPNIFGTQ
jgi:AsmA protein